jgi:hypothetical protein
MISFVIPVNSIPSQDVEPDPGDITSENAGAQFIRLNKLILNNTIIFNPNQSVLIHLSIENINPDPIFNVHFNDTYNMDDFEVVDSTNPTDQSNFSVEKTWNSLSSGEKVSFNTTIKILSASSQRMFLDKTNVTIEATEFHIPTFLESNELEFSVRAEEVVVEDSLEKINGEINSDLISLVFLLGLPLIVALVINFAFGLRRRGKY